MDKSWSSIHFPLHYESFRRAGLSFQRFRRALKAARLRRPLSICSPALPHLWSWHSASVCTWEGVDAELVCSVHSPSVCSHSVTTELCACMCACACVRVWQSRWSVQLHLFYFSLIWDMKELISAFVDERMKSITVFIPCFTPSLLLTFIDWFHSIFSLLPGMFLLFV